MHSAVAAFARSSAASYSRIQDSADASRSFSCRRSLALFWVRYAFSVRERSTAHHCRLARVTSSQGGSLQHSTS